MATFKIFFEIAEKALAVLAKVSFLMGGAILLVYCVRYGGFPEGVSVGDTLSIFFAFTVFSIGTLTVYFFLMCLGVSLWRMVFRISRFNWAKRIFIFIWMLIRTAGLKKTRLLYGPSEFYRNYKRPQPFLYSITFPTLTPMFHFLSGLTLFIILTIVHEALWVWYLKFLTSALFIGGWYIFIDFNRQRDAQMDFIFDDTKTTVKLRSEIRLLNLAGTAFVFIGGTFFLGLFDTTANQTMRLLGIRHDHATVYARETWSTVLIQHGIVGTKSYLKPYVSRYDNVTVALSSFGTSVSLQFQADGKTLTFRIPATEVLIDPQPSQTEKKE